MGHKGGGCPPPLYQYHQAHDLGDVAALPPVLQRPVMSVAGGGNEHTAGAIYRCSRFLWFWCFFQGEWSADCWPASWARMDLLRNLTQLERFLIIVAIELWGERLHNR